MDHFIAGGSMGLWVYAKNNVVSSSDQRQGEPAPAVKLSISSCEGTCFDGKNQIGIQELWVFKWLDLGQVIPSLSLSLLLAPQLEDKGEQNLNVCQGIAGVSCALKQIIPAARLVKVRCSPTWERNHGDHLIFWEEPNLKKAQFCWGPKELSHSDTEICKLLRIPYLSLHSFFNSTSLLPSLPQPCHFPLLQQVNQILSSWTVQWKVSLKRQYIIFHEFNRVFMILQSASTRHSQLEAAQREAEALHLGFSTLAKIHWIWSGMTMNLWNVQSLFSCLIQIKKKGSGEGGAGKCPMRIPYGNTKRAL